MMSPCAEPCAEPCFVMFFLTWYGSHTQRIMVYVKIMWYHGQNPINYVQSKLRGPVCEFFLTNDNLSGNYKKCRARDLKFLVHLEKLVESCGLRFGVMSKMRDFTQPSICLLKTQIKIRNNNLKLVCFWTTEIVYFFLFLVAQLPQKWPPYRYQSLIEVSCWRRKNRQMPKNPFSVANQKSIIIAHFWRYAKTDSTPFHQLFETNKKR